MPTYEYRCTACDHLFEEYQSITARPLKKCPSCGRNTLSRLIGSGAGVIFKGSGFYQTDYRSESYRKAAEAEAKPASTGGDDKGAGSQGTKKRAESPAGESTDSTNSRKAG